MSMFVFVTLRNSPGTEVFCAGLWVVKQNPQKMLPELLAPRLSKHAQLSDEDELCFLKQSCQGVGEGKGKGTEAVQSS